MALGPSRISASPAQQGRTSALQLQAAAAQPSSTLALRATLHTHCLSLIGIAAFNLVTAQLCWQQYCSLCTIARQPQMRWHASKPAVCCAEAGTGPEFHSALGMFIRKCCLTFWAMSFEVGAAKAYHLQRAPATVPLIL